MACSQNDLQRHLTMCSSYGLTKCSAGGPPLIAPPAAAVAPVDALISAAAHAGHVTSLCQGSHDGDAWPCMHAEEAKQRRQLAGQADQVVGRSHACAWGGLQGQQQGGPHASTGSSPGCSQRPALPLQSHTHWPCSWRARPARAARHPGQPAGGWQLLPVNIAMLQRAKGSCRSPAQRCDEGHARVINPDISASWGAAVQPAINAHKRY